MGYRYPYGRRHRQIRDLLTGFIEKNTVASKRLVGGKKASMIGDSLPVDGPLSRTYSDRVMAVWVVAWMVLSANCGGKKSALVLWGVCAGGAVYHVHHDNSPSR